MTSDRRGNAKLGKMGADRINHRDLLPNEQVPRAMKHQAALLLRRLALDNDPTSFNVDHVRLLAKRACHAFIRTQTIGI